MTSNNYNWQSGNVSGPSGLKCFNFENGSFTGDYLCLPIAITPSNPSRKPPYASANKIDNIVNYPVDGSSSFYPSNSQNIPQNEGLSFFNGNFASPVSLSDLTSKTCNSDSNAINSTYDTETFLKNWTYFIDTNSTINAPPCKTGSPINSYFVSPPNPSLCPSYEQLTKSQDPFNTNTRPDEVFYIPQNLQGTNLYGTDYTYQMCAYKIKSDQDYLPIIQYLESPNPVISNVIPSFTETTIHPTDLLLYKYCMLENTTTNTCQQVNFVNGLPGSGKTEASPTGADCLNIQTDQRCKTWVTNINQSFIGNNKKLNDLTNLYTAFVDEVCPSNVDLSLRPQCACAQPNQNTDYTTIVNDKDLKNQVPNFNSNQLYCWYGPCFLPTKSDQFLVPYNDQTIAIATDSGLPSCPQICAIIVKNIAPVVIQIFSFYVNTCGKSNFWSKYKWWIIGGILLFVFVIILIVVASRKKK